jgi:putative cardiolipin synthase
LLEIGVELWEARTGSDYLKKIQKNKKLGYSQAGLHAKTFTIDEQYVYIGSFNWDPRSIDLNTEMGVYLDSPDVTQKVNKEYRDRLHEFAYKVRLNDSGSLEWVAYDSGKEKIYTKGPETGFWTRFKTGFIKLLPIEDQL